MVVQDDKVPYVVGFKSRLSVEFDDVGLAYPVMGKHLDQADDAALHKMDAG